MADTLDKQSSAVESAREDTVQARGRGEAPMGGGRVLLQLTNFSHIDDPIPPWWSFARDIQLRRFWKRVDHLAGAVNTFTDRIATVPFRIEARDKSIRSHVEKAQKIEQDLRMAAEFGEAGGWTTWVKKFVEDLITQDNGAFSEVIGDGPANGPIKGSPIAPAHLDSARCTRTGHPEYPVLYEDLDGQQYRLHHTRVMFTSQMPSPMAEMYGVGFCAVSRCVNVAQNLLDIMVYKQERLGSRPMREMLITRGGLDPEDIREGLRIAEMEMNSAQLRRYSKIIVAGSGDLDEAGVDKVTLNTLPDGWDEQTSTVVAMAVIALAFGVDARELFPAMSIGATKADALIQHLKQRGKGLGQVLTKIEDLFNYKYLPPWARMVFDFQDDAEDRQVAEIRELYSGVRNVNLQSKSSNMRTEREQMKERGEITHAQFIELELDDGRMEDGTESVALFFNDEYSKYLDLKSAYEKARGGDPEDVAYDPEEKVAEMEEEETAQAQLAEQQAAEVENGAVEEKQTPFARDTIPATERANGGSEPAEGEDAEVAEREAEAGGQDGEVASGSPLAALMGKPKKVQIDWEDPLNTRINDANLMLDLVQIKLGEAYRDLVQTPSSKQRIIKEAISALKALKRMYGGDSEMGEEEEGGMTPPQLQPFTGEQGNPAAPNMQNASVNGTEIQQGQRDVEQDTETKSIEELAEILVNDYQYIEKSISYTPPIASLAELTEKDMECITDDERMELLKEAAETIRAALAALRGDVMAPYHPVQTQQAFAPYNPTIYNVDKNADFTPPPAIVLEQDSEAIRELTQAVVNQRGLDESKLDKVLASMLQAKERDDGTVKELNATLKQVLEAVLTAKPPVVNVQNAIPEMPAPTVNVTTPEVKVDVPTQPVSLTLEVPETEETIEIVRDQRDRAVAMKKTKKAKGS